MRKVLSRYIYVIDSSLNDCLMISHSLRQVGFEVSYDIEGHRGVATVMAVPPQCLILDSILPGVNGYAILRQIRAAYPQPTLPIIVTSTKHSDLDRNYTLGLGADCYLDKPFTPQQLVQAVWDVLPPSAQKSAQMRQNTPVPSPTEQFSRPKVPNLIPCRRERMADILRGSNPFASNADIADLQLRRLYAAVDNHRSVQALSTIMQLSLQTTLSLLEQLWKLQYIVLYDVEQEPYKEIDFSRLRTYVQEEM
jgi:CheY-like chemotaxis protein